MSEILKTNTTLTSLNLSGVEEGKRERERNDEQLTDNKFGDEGKKMVIESWGNRGGKLWL